MKAQPPRNVRPNETRSHEAPMDFTYESEERRKNAWDDPFNSNISNSHTAPPFPIPQPHDHNAPQNPTFGTASFTNSNFAFSAPSSTPSVWTSPSKSIVDEPEVADISMHTAGTATPSPKKGLGTSPSPPTSSPVPSSKRLRHKRSAGGGGELVLSDSHQRMYKTHGRIRAREKERSMDMRRGLIQRDESDDEGYSEDAHVTTTQHVNFHFPISHRELPYILIGYLQLSFNSSLFLAFLYLTFNFILTVQRDVDKKVTEYSAALLHDITACTTQYIENRCDPATRVPLMEETCKRLERCMKRDPTVVGRARVTAETFAEVINSFVEPITWKTLAFTLVTLTFVIITINFLLSYYRSRFAPTTTIAPPQQALSGLHAPPATPFLLGPSSTTTWTSTMVPPSRGTSMVPETPSRRKKMQ